MVRIFRKPERVEDRLGTAALLAGNAVLFKPSEQTPATAEHMLRLWERAGLPPGTDRDDEHKGE